MPPREADPAAELTDTVTGSVDVVRLPYWSRNCTTGCVDSSAPDTPATGAVTIANCVGEPGCVATVSDVPVSDAVVAVTVMAVLATVEAVRVTVATPLASVLVVVAENDWPGAVAEADHVTT